MRTYLSGKYFLFDSDNHISYCPKCQVAGKRYKAFREEPKEVAQVWVDKNLNINQILDKAFMLTNSIDDAWWNNEEVTKMFGGEGCRSTSVGDFVLIGAKKYECMMAGWELVK